MRDRILSWLADHVPPARVRHILGVETMAGDLADHYHLNKDQARLAGLLHDLAKYFQPQSLLQIAKDSGLEIDSICEQNPHLLHADVSAIVAQNEFQIEDQEILEAIRNHTLGRPQMSLLSCIVFIADALEPSRGNTPTLENLRRQSYDNPYKSVWHTSDYGLRFLLDKRCTIHPRTILTRNWAMEQTSRTLRKEN